MDFYLDITNSNFKKITDIFDLSEFKTTEVEPPPYNSYLDLKIEINSLSDLFKLMDKTDSKIVISKNSFGYELEIYNDYRE